METVEAEPIFGKIAHTRNYHLGWECYCPYCDEYWQSPSTTCYKKVRCNTCEEVFYLKYPEGGFPSLFFFR